MCRLDRAEWQIKAFCLVPGWEDFLAGVGVEGKLLEPRRTIVERILGRGHSFLSAHLSKKYEGSLRVLTFPHYRLLPERLDLMVIPEQNFVVAPFIKRRISVIHDLMHIYEPAFPEVGSEDEVNGRNALFTSITRFNTDVLVDSYTGREHVRAHFPSPKTRLHVLPFVAPASLVHSAPQKPKKELPHRFLFYPAQFWPHKNHVRLVEAAASLRESCPDLHFVFSGTTKYAGYGPFLEKVNALGMQAHFTVLGYIPEEEIAWLYRHARALVMPTFFGPTNIPPLEAMTLGCPVAVSGVYGMPEQCGNAAVYLEPGSVPSIANAIYRLWTDDALCKELAAEGLTRSRRWNEEAFMKEFLYIISSKQ